MIGEVDRLGRAGAAQYIRDAFPDMSNREINRLLNYAERSIEVGNSFELGNPDRVGGVSRAPINPLLPADCEYRYRVEVSWHDPINDNTASRPAYVCSDERLTPNQVYALALEAVSQGINVRGYDDRGFSTLSPDDLNYDIISVERRG